MTRHNTTPEQRDAVMDPWWRQANADGWEVDADPLYWAAVDGLAWNLLEQTMDTADREPSPDQFRAARDTAERILAARGNNTDNTHATTRLLTETPADRIRAADGTEFINVNDVIRILKRRGVDTTAEDDAWLRRTLRNLIDGKPDDTQFRVGLIRRLFETTDAAPAPASAAGVSS